MSIVKNKTIVSTIVELISNASTITVASINGMNVAEVDSLRRSIRKVDGNIRVFKNRLLKRAIESTKFKGISTFLKGQNIIVWSKDPSTAAKVISDFEKTSGKIKVLGGSFNDRTLTSDEVKILGNLPSIEVVRSQLVGILKFPQNRIYGNISYIT